MAGAVARAGGATVYFSVRDAADERRLLLSGDWRIGALGVLEPQLAALEGRAGLRRLVIDAGGLDALDFSGAWVLHRLTQRARAEGIEVAFAGTMPDALRLVDETLRTAPGAAAAIPPPRAAPFDELASVTELGRQTVQGWRGIQHGLAFVGRVSTMLLRGLRSTRRLRPRSIARHVYDSGFTAIPIVSLIAFLISVIVAYMGAQQLLRFGADIFVVDLVTVAVLREMAVLLTAIIVAGRSASAYAAEIGAMRLNEEVDALRAIGIDPIEVLILPRVLGLVIALPLLTVIADAIGLVGGALLCRFLLNMPLTQFLSRMQEAIAPTTFWVGIIKAPVFALLIAMAGTYRGMQVEGSSRELGRLTTVAVVQAIFLVILADAVFAVLFQRLDI
jgi:phospholipid/cholesterol/gamma-HCH transport system permease protein